MIYGSYLAKSIKKCEEVWSSELDVDSVEYIDLDNSSPVPPVMANFWACSGNKELLQLLSQ